MTKGPASEMEVTVFFGASRNRLQHERDVFDRDSEERQDGR